MLTGIRHKVAIALGCVLLALALAACGGTPDSTPAPTPDIEGGGEVDDVIEELRTRSKPYLDG